AAYERRVAVFSSQRVADAVDRADLGRAVERRELAPEARDVHVEGVLVDDRAVGPCGPNELAPAHCGTRRTCEAGEEPELGRRQVDARPATGRRMRRGVDPQTARLEGGVRSAPLDQSAQARDELGDREGLGQVVVATGGESRETVRKRVPRG